MSASRSIEVKLDGRQLKALGGAPGAGGPVAFRLHGDLPGLPTAARGDAFVTAVAEKDPVLAERLGRLMPALLSHEAELFEWLSRGEDHGRRFVEDPAGALAEAVPGLPPQLMTDLRAVAQELTAKGGTR
jgi:hypothetical protein